MVDGRNKILLFRLQEKQDEEAAKLVFQTEHTFSYERDMDRIITKDGPILQVGELESTVEITAIQAKDDPVAKMLRNSVIEGKRLEVWELTVDEDAKNDDDKYPAIYAQGYLESWEDVAGAEDEPEVTGTLNIEMHPQFDYATLTADQEAAVQYEFRDTTPRGENGGGGGES
ncbi:phage major tail protein, TP901-1 family [Salicibibacter halophilus]|uniref:Phage major tail protein, TP901-1 family n=2 Tax=Salicibibacter halophilus TaxID=2502791 RepID=A0A514LNL8_9BACI|nr:phage major tail protein, TP901-1 family [Salicibibacter halophilus]